MKYGIRADHADDDDEHMYDAASFHRRENMLKGFFDPVTLKADPNIYLDEMSALLLFDGAQLQMHSASNIGISWSDQLWLGCVMKLDLDATLTIYGHRSFVRCINKKSNLGE